ncbi:MAG: hypothetical protein D3908_04290, partial [Candidatus Electrothrix sp. AUS4]|nr:hypothetical protein [Candidatus Electrothrix sp. AUS4]
MRSLSSLARSHGFLGSLLFVFPLLFLLILTGCSSDDVQVELTGRIDQSFAAGTKVCLDISGNGQCDADEPSAQTNSDGTYKITIPVESLDKFPLIVESATSSDNAQEKTVKLSAPAGKYAFVSPVSTAVQDKVYQGNSLAEAEAAVRSRYSLPDDVDLYADYQESSVDSGSAQALIRALEEVAADYGIDYVDEEGSAEVVADGQQVVGRRVGKQATVSSLEAGNAIADNTADFSSVTAGSVGVAAVASSDDADGEVQAQTTDEHVLVVSADEMNSAEAVAEKVVATAAACMAKLVHAGGLFDSIVPPAPAAGEPVTITFGLNNVSEPACDANGYKLAFHSVMPASPECLSGNYTGSNPTFSIAAGATGQV